MNRDFDAGTLVLAGSSALRVVRAQRRRAGFLPWEALNKVEQRRALTACVPRARDIDWPALTALGAWNEDVDDALSLFVGSASARADCNLVTCQIANDLPAKALVRINPWLVSASPAYLPINLYDRLSEPELYGLMLELTNNVSLSDRCGYLPPLSCPGNDAEALVNYCNANAACTPADIRSMLAKTGPRSKPARLKRYAAHLFEGADSPMECIMGAQYVLPYSLGGFNCGPALFNHRIQYSDRARAISGMPYAVADCYFPISKEILEYNGDYHSDPAARIHDERRNAALETMGIKVVAINRATIRDLDALEAIAWDIHRRAGGRYQNRISNRYWRQLELMNGLRRAFGLPSI